VLKCSGEVRPVARCRARPGGGVHCNLQRAQYWCYLTM
jgi:hypothetical protein